MSLSSFLLKSDATKDRGKAIDKGLDDLFKSTAVAPKLTKQKPATPAPAGTPQDVEIRADKKRKSASERQSPAKAKKSRRALVGGAAPAEAKSQPKASSSKATIDAPKKQPSAEPRAEESTSGDEDAEDQGPDGRPENESDGSDPEQEDYSTSLVHESVTVGGKSKTISGKIKYVPPEETSEQRDARTVFVGNVLMDIVKSKPMQKQFSRYILSFVPDAKIESIRFRSVAFQKPTTELPADNPSSKSMSKEGRQHDRDRAASWRASKGKDDDEEAAPAKTFLTPKEKKRIAFIKQEIHSGVDSVNAYIVFAHPVPAESRPKNLPPLKPIMDPYEAAKAAIRAADGSVFMDRTLRLDLAAKGKGKAREIVNAESPDDPKATIFVGNLDFAAKEEDVRVFFEGLVVTERGEPTEIQAEDAERSDEKAWVKRVRLIRDKDTLLGKGFGYVQFMDRECVDEILALEQDRLKFAKRKLRVQRCKTLPGASKVAPARPSAQTKTVVQTKGTSQTRSLPAAPAPVPKGDPSLGAKLAGLSKEERKKLKATDADRVARRLAKKKAKALADHGVKARESTKERVRERKRPMDKSGAAESSKSKKRVRSSKALAKMNMKK